NLTFCSLSLTLLADTAWVGARDRFTRRFQSSVRSILREKVYKMRRKSMILAALGGLALSACAQQEEEVAAAPPPPPGSVAGSVAADRDGDGIIDGYYTSDGIYHANYVPPPPAPPSAPTMRGERG
ncbi:MAG: hypothetical protein ACRCY3_01910, partial [Sphingorhabdus sp.]